MIKLLFGAILLICGALIVIGILAEGTLDLFAIGFSAVVLFAGWKLYQAGRQKMFLSSRAYKMARDMYLTDKRVNLDRIESNTESKIWIIKRFKRITGFGTDAGTIEKTLNALQKKGLFSVDADLYSGWTTLEQPSKKKWKWGGIAFSIWATLDTCQITPTLPEINNQSYEDDIFKFLCVCAVGCFLAARKVRVRHGEELLKLSCGRNVEFNCSIEGDKKNIYRLWLTSECINIHARESTVEQPYSSVQSVSLVTSKGWLAKRLQRNKKFWVSISFNDGQEFILGLWGLGKKAAARRAEVVELIKSKVAEIKNIEIPPLVESQTSNQEQSQAESKTGNQDLPQVLPVYGNANLGESKLKTPTADERKLEQFQDVPILPGVQRPNLQPWLNADPRILQQKREQWRADPDSLEEHWAAFFDGYEVSSRIAELANPLPIPDKKNRAIGGGLVLTIFIMVLGFVVYLGLVESGHIAGFTPLNNLIRIGKAEQAPIFNRQPPRKASSGTLTVGDTNPESSQYKDPNSKYKALFDSMDEYFVDLYTKNPVHLLFEDIKFKYVAIDQRSFEEITHPFLNEKGIEFTVVTHWVFAGDQDFYTLREQWFAPYNDKGQVVIHGGDTTGMGLILREEDIERGKAAVDWYYKKIGVTRKEMDQVMREQLDREEAQREAKEAEVAKAKAVREKNLEKTSKLDAMLADREFDLKVFMQEYFETLEFEANLYAALFNDFVDYQYYKQKGLASRNFILNHHMKFCERWPKRRYLQDGKFEYRLNGDSDGEVLIPFEYIYEDTKGKMAKGYATDFLGVKWVGNRWKIVKFKQTVRRKRNDK